MFKDFPFVILNLFRKETKKNKYEGKIRFEAGSLFIDRKPDILNGIDLMAPMHDYSGPKSAQYPTCNGCGDKLTEHFFSSKLTGRVLCAVCFEKLQRRERTAKVKNTA
jgi:formylmethanofuran dehydrogenase subunit E